LHFNLSNTPGLVVCAVSVAHSQVGVDAEGIDAHAVDPQLAEMHFAPEEASALRDLPTGEWKRCFFAYWALKESHIKARGLGLALDLDQIVLRFDDGNVCAGFGPRLAGDAADWRFVLIDVGPRHLIGLSVDTGGAPLSLRAARVVPLDGT
jgi:4'-phosphopantetheinyl transferase